MNEHSSSYIRNPLTIIGIFAGITEVGGNVVLPFIKNDNIQIIYIWFLVVFPIILVSFFFLTLNFNSNVLYAPSDYKNEENYVKLKNYDTLKQATLNENVKLNEYTKGVVKNTISSEVSVIKSALDKQKFQLADSENAVKNLYKIELNPNLEGTSFHYDLLKKGFFISIYQSNYFKVDSVQDSSAIWLGKNVPLEIAKEVIVSASQHSQHLKYIHISGDQSGEPPLFVHDQIFIGGSTSTAKEYKLKEIKTTEFKSIESFKTIDELHSFVRNYYA
ncbi:hypothetical protein CH370_09585 [Leptospira kmetyi]|uniref:hypothetical protein n=1 Tax=Leptospira kmetyi TaxID=408139 RepID=UPI000C2A91DC|nr:hypothetical protein [Leptospira kmetyi]PJZ41684.1 hypothetical protein CH370_09585 [Leptospira kmetyi]